MPHLKELAQKHRDAGLVVIGVHTTNGGEKMAAFVAEQGIGYPVAIDVDNQTTKAFAVDSYPDYYLIDRAGNLRVADLQNKAVDQAVAALLAEPAPPQDPTQDPKQDPKAKPDAEKLYADALALAKKTDRKLLVHVHGPG